MSSGGGGGGGPPGGLPGYGPPGSGGRGGGTGAGWSSPLPFRPPSPYGHPMTPPPPARLPPGSPGMNMFANRMPPPPPFIPCPRPRWPHTVGGAMSPGPPPLPGVSPTPSPLLPPGPKPFKLPMHPPSPAPRGPTPEYFKGVHPYSRETSATPEHFFRAMHHHPMHPSPNPYSPDHFGPPSRDYEYVSAPMEAPPPLPRNYEPEEEDSGPSTAEIIANQSQDYIDEKLAEYQATIYLLQGK